MVKPNVMIVYSRFRTLTRAISAGWTLGFLCAVLGASPALAQIDAYSVEVAVADRTVEEQQIAYQVAMRTVLLKNSGDKTLLNRDDVRAGLSEAEAYVELFRYRKPEPGTVISSGTPLTDRVRNSGQATQLMLVRFDHKRIRSLIDGEQSTRVIEGAAVDPLTNVTTALVWMLVEDGERDILIGGNTGNNVMLRAREIAGGKGISLVFVAADEIDQIAVSNEAIRNSNIEQIRLASERYAQPVILVGYLARNQPRGWTGEWTKISATTVQDSSFTSKSLDSGLQKGIEWLSPQTSNANGVAGTSINSPSRGSAQSETESLVWISAVDTTAGYAEIVSFLSDIESVSVVYPKEVSANGMVFALSPRGALSDVAAAVANISWLRQTAPPDPANSGQLGRNAELALDYLR